MKKLIFATLLAASLGGAVPGLAMKAGHTIELASGGQATAKLDAALAAEIGETTIQTAIFVMGDEKHEVRGVLMRDLMKHLDVMASKTASVTALDGYAFDVPTDDFLNYDLILATNIDGKDLSIRDKGPAWVIYPISQHKEFKDTVYDARSVWQVKSINFH